MNTLTETMENRLALIPGDFVVRTTTMTSLSDCEQENQKNRLHSSDEEIYKLVTMFGRQVQNRDSSARSKTSTPSELKVSTTSSIPAPTRFTRKKKAVGDNQTGNLCPQFLHVVDNELPVKADAPYVLFQPMGSVPSEIDAVKIYNST